MPVVRVLYVDDEPGLREIGRIFLEEGGRFRVDTVGSAPEALAILAQEKFDAIVSDYQMPGMDGIALLKQVRASGNTIPFILFTGRGREEVVIQAINEGADFYLQKGGDPVPQFTELSHKISQAVQKRQAEKMLLESQAQLRTIVDAIPVGILTIDPVTHRILDANPRAAGLIGLPRSGIVGQVCHRFICPTETGKCPVTDLGQTIDLSERILLDQAGTRIPVLKSVVRAVIGGQDVLVESFFDIADRKRQEEELSGQNRRLIAVRDMEQEFAALLSAEPVEKLAARTLRDLAGAVVTTFNVYDRNRQVLHPAAIEIAPGVFRNLPDVWQTVTRWVGMDPMEMTLPVTPAMYQDIRRSYITTWGSITEMTGGRISPVVSTGIQKLGGIGRFLLITHVIEGELYGTSLVGLRADQPDPPGEILDSFAHIVALSLRRQQAEAALRESEDRYRTLIENADEAVLVIQDQMIRFANRKLMEITGYSEKDYVRPFLQFVYPDDRALVEKQHQARLSGEILKDQYTFRIIAKDGSILWNEIRSSLITWNGRPAVMVILQDITERKAAEQALKESEAKFRETVHNIPGIVFRFRVGSDGAGVLTFFSDRARDILGIDPGQENLFAVIAGHIHPEDREQFHASIADAVRSRGPWRAEGRFIRPSGETIWLEGRSDPVPYGDALMYTGFISEITERKRAETALRESEEKFRSLVAYSLEPILIADFAGTVILANKATAHLVGADGDVVLTGRKILDFIAPESREEVIRDLRHVASGSDAFPATYSILSLQKRTIRVECIGKLIRYEGRPADLISLRDITESEKAVTALRESEEKYRMLTTSLPEFIFIHREGIILYVNQAIAEITGRSAEELYGHPFMEFVAPESRAIVEENLQLREEGNPRSTYEIAILIRHGEKRFGIVNSTRITYEGSPASLVVVSDITHLRFAEDALRRSNRQLTLLSSITRHDINNQLMALNGFVSILQSRITDPSVEPYFSRIATASGQIDAMIRFTREFEKIGLRAPAWQDLRGLVESAGNHVTAGTIRVQNDLVPGTEIFADPLIVKVFFNLIDNAVRHGGRVTIVRFSSESDNGNFRVVCEDDGAGVAGEDKARIFDRGFGKNTGFGLAISREILDITGITIAETGTPGKGARFEITIPDGAFRVRAE